MVYARIVKDTFHNVPPQENILSPLPPGAVWVRLFTALTSTWEVQFKGQKIYFGSQFQRCWSMVPWPYCFRPEARLNIMVVGSVAQEDAHFMAARGQGQDIPFKSTAPWPTSSNKAPHYTVALSPTSLFKIWIHQWTNLFIKSEPSGSNPLQKYLHSHPEVCFPNLLGGSQSNQVDNQD
jgi:hypothetical protein